MKKTLKKLEKKVEDDAATLALKADQADLEDVRDIIMALPNDEEVREFRNYVTASIENFASDNKTF